MTKPRHADHFEDAYFAMSAETVARRLDISVTTLNELVAEGLIPKSFPIPGHPRLQRWDPEDVKAIIKDWKERANPSEKEKFGDVR
jgi:predicted DNA-binding transcriptional regulator AlpA